ncbi:MAG: signal transduction histidine kinase/CheY-like chemotaxis protein [Polaribacter sp.]
MTLAYTLFKPKLYNLIKRSLLKKSVLHLLVIILITLFSNFVKSEEMIDLTKNDIYIRAGFEHIWTTQLPKELPSPWLKLSGSQTSGRSVTIQSQEIHSFLYNKSTDKINTKPQTFTFVTSFSLNRDNNKKNPFIGLFLSTIGNNWQVFLNGHLIRSEVFIDQNGEIKTHRFLRDILIQLEDKRLKNGLNLLAFKIIGLVNNEATGLYARQSYLVGNYDKLVEKRVNLTSIVLSFTYLILGLFFVFMYIKRTKGLYNLTFGLLCISLFIYLITRTALIQQYFQDSLIIIRFEYLSLYLFSGLSMMFFDQILGYKLTIYSKIFLSYILVLSIFTLFRNSIVADQLLKLWQYSAILSIGYVLFYRMFYESIKAYKKLVSNNIDGKIKQHFFSLLKETLFGTIAGNLLIGTLGVSITSAINIIQSANNVTNSIFEVKYAFFIFMISNTAVLISKFVKAQTQAEDLTLNLEKKINDRTTSLTKANQNLEMLNQSSETMLIDLVKARDEANQSNNAKGEFLANMSHEIRTPMNGVIGMLRMLSDTKLSTQQQEFSEIASSSAKSLLSLINDILDFSKMEAGKFELESTTFNIHKIMNQFNGMVSLELEEKGIQFNNFVDKNVPIFLIGDQNRLRQILINLIGNAKKFTSGGSISIAIHLVERLNKKVVINFSVKDTGIGISKSNQQELFDKFSQADKSTTRKYGGTGLGLAISKQLVEAMKGEITVESEEGKGSEFSFTAQFGLPTENQLDIFNKQNNTHKNQDNKFQIHTDQLAKLDVLVAEDNKINQMVIKGILKKIGINTIISNNGKEALEHLKSNHFDIVFMDLQMPEMDGIEATRLIRSGKAGELNKDVIIVAATANAMKGDIEKCLSAGMNDYLSKPILFEEMDRVVRKWLC